MEGVLKSYLIRSIVPLQFSEVSSLWSPQSSIPLHFHWLGMHFLFWQRNWLSEHIQQPFRSLIKSKDILSICNVHLNYSIHCCFPWFSMRYTTFTILFVTVVPAIINAVANTTMMNAFMVLACKITATLLFIRIISAIIFSITCQRFWNTFLVWTSKWIFWATKTSCCYCKIGL